MAERLQESHALREKNAAATLAAFFVGALLGGILGWVAGGQLPAAATATNVAIGCAVGLAAVAVFRWVLVNDVLSEASDIDPGTYRKNNVGAHAPDSDTPLGPSPDVTRSAAPRRHA